MLLPLPVFLFDSDVNCGSNDGSAGEGCFRLLGLLRLFDPLLAVDHHLQASYHRSNHISIMGIDCFIVVAVAAEVVK